MPALENAPFTPKQLYEYLDKYVVGQTKAKKALSVAVYKHYKRISLNEKSDGNTSMTTTAADSKDHKPIKKSNVILVGPSGSGKTLLVETIARCLDVPFAICDCSRITAAGYIGGNVEDVLHDLLRSSKDDVAKAQRGIVFLDEVDKIASTVLHGTRDIGGRGVQQCLLKMVEGSLVGLGREPKEHIDTTDILFVAAGAFFGLDKIVEKRKLKMNPKDQAKTASPGSLEEKYGGSLGDVEARDLMEYGLIPEFVGRFPILSVLDEPSEDMLLDVLKGTENSIVSQYQKLLETDECVLTFDDAALRVLAQRAIKLGTGVRGLRTIVEEILLEPLFNIPGSDIIEIYIEVADGVAVANYKRRAKVSDRSEAESITP